VTYKLLATCRWNSLIIRAVNQKNRMAEMGNGILDLSAGQFLDKCSSDTLSSLHKPASSRNLLEDLAGSVSWDHVAISVNGRTPESISANPTRVCQNCHTCRKTKADHANRCRSEIGLRSDILYDAREIASKIFQPYLTKVTVASTASSKIEAEHGKTHASEKITCFDKESILIHVAREPVRKD